MAAAAGGGALRAESRITPPKIQGGAAEVKTPASFPILSHNFGKPRSARRIRAARAGLERPRQAAPAAAGCRGFAARGQEGLRGGLLRALRGLRVGGGCGGVEERVAEHGTESV